jgi:Ca-activated chloride channel family protein
MKTKYVNFLATALLVVAIVSCKNTGTTTVTTTKVEPNILIQNEPGKNQPITSTPERKEETQKNDLRVIEESEIIYNIGAEQGNADKRAIGPSSISHSYHSPAPSMKSKVAEGYNMQVADGDVYEPQPDYNTENYSLVRENEFLAAKENPLSTFSIDVDAASYSNSRRYLTSGSLPPADAVRIEEFINYFDYQYAQPQGEHPFSFNTEISSCPWNAKHCLVHIGMQGKRIPFEQIAPMNLVFLIDVSGSMSDANKLPLLKKSFTLLTSKLRAEDHVAIVVYAGAAGVVLPSTAGSEKSKIIAALDNLEAGGSTAGGEGIILAYKIANQNLIKGGLNRVIIATDGDFNIGASSDAEMTRLIEERRNDGIYITSLGFGMGNYKDSRMESIADNGNGNYFYIDNIDEARKVLVTQLDGTLYTIAKDVKLQIEFNPAKVKAYRLVGYENRMLKKEDFNNDKKDAGELGAGHTVTALYEIIPAGSEETTESVDPLRYSQPIATKNVGTEEIMTLKFRYKKPADTTSKLIVTVVKDENLAIGNTSDNFRFSASVASFGMILRNSKFKGATTYDDIVTMANQAKGKDEEGYRAEFIKLVKNASMLSGLAKK